MPIRPENAGRYPKDWPAIRQRILERAGNACEGSPIFPDCRIPNGAWRWATGDGNFYWSLDEDEAFALSEKPTRIVLTIGHLDHTPENCLDENLRAWCQRCHLAYDHEHHQQNAHATRRGRKAIGDLFED